LRAVGAPLSDSDLELRVSSRAPGPRSAVASAGLPTMVAPIVELLRAVANGSGAVETEWTTTIHPPPANST
jgi:hypothetical protein